MNYMQNYPNGLPNTRSHKTHVEAAENSLKAAVTYQKEIDKHTGGGHAILHSFST
jgi:hypothetical protein